MLPLKFDPSRILTQSLPIRLVADIYDGLRDHFMLSWLWLTGEQARISIAWKLQMNTEVIVVYAQVCLKIINSVLVTTIGALRHFETG